MKGLFTLCMQKKSRQWRSSPRPFLRALPERGKLKWGSEFEAVGAIAQSLHVVGLFDDSLDGCVRRREEGGSCWTGRAGPMAVTAGVVVK